MRAQFRKVGKQSADDGKRLVNPGTILSDAPAPPAMRLPDTARIERYLTAATDKANELTGNENVKKCLDVTTPMAILCIKGIMFITPYYRWLAVVCYRIYKKLPMNMIQMVFGAALCFFGGVFVASIAAIEAFRQMGWDRVKADIKVVMDQAAIVSEANDEDDTKDDDGDGIPDVQQIGSQELVQRKVTLAMTTIKEPKRLQVAVGALWAAYLAVLATLRLEFARTTALALGIVEMIKLPLIRAFAPLLSAALGPDMVHWTQTLIETTISVLAIIIAWYLQMIISAFYSGLRGGRMFATGLCDLLIERGWMQKLPFVKKPFDPNETYVDEAVAYGLGAVGFLYQIFTGFALPFPLNLVFLPLSIIEWFLRFQISMEQKLV